MQNEAIIVKVNQSVMGSDPINTQSIDPMLSQFFRLNESEVTNSDRSKLSEIDEYVNSIAKDEMDKVSILKDLRYKLGHPKMGVSEVAHLHRYIRVKNSIKSQEASLMAMEQ